ncbi:sensor histidine kinase [Sphingobium sp. SCG-1]|uniref:sensor histidine kinase n=1 Tax=Sphingobium sp. SCG-1 TaxID=2072936 RepID=UPI0016706289|nr:ATP-binding protein [Sphingobium sp. SCG-1]
MVAFAALALMGVALGMGLARADHLLDRVSRSQNQLAMATRLEADVNAFMLLPPGDSDGESRHIYLQLSRLRLSIAEESMTLIGEERRRQPDEVAALDTLQNLFAKMKGSNAEIQTALLAAEFRIRVQGIVQNERSEADRSIRAMRDLKRRGSIVAAATPAILIVFGAIFAWLMINGLVRPIRALRRAVLDVTRDEVSGPIELTGYADFKDLTAAFTEMACTIKAQKTTLERVNKDLEAQVTQRTAELSDQLARLAEIDASRRLFFAQVSHELRTPLTVVLGEAETALRDLDAAPVRLRDALQHILANGQFAHRRLEDLLGLARAQDGKLTLQRDDVDLRKIMQASCVQAESYARSSGLTILSESPDMVIGVKGDASWLQQALLALVDNAIKYASEGGVIRMSLVHDASLARLSVFDDGPGVADHELPRLFETYHQASANRRRGGSGLGLAVARWVIQSHQGTISAKNCAQGGLAILIELPLAS